MTIVGCLHEALAASFVSKHRQKTLNSIRVGVDTGGTFTDFVYQANDELRIFKVASTPDDPARAITEGLKQIAAKADAKLLDFEIVHGTTVGTNALLQRKGARTALVTTEGFEDVLEIGRQARPELYNLNAIKPPPLVPSELRFGVKERVAANGEVLERLNNEALVRLVEQVQTSGCESIAVSLLFSFVDPRHEMAIARALESFGVPLSISHQVLPEYREYERTATVCVNAYLQPLMGRYLRNLGTHASGMQHARGVRTSLKLRVMQSSGGSISA